MSNGILLREQGWFSNLPLAQMVPPSDLVGEPWAHWSGTLVL